MEGEGVGGHTPSIPSCAWAPFALTLPVLPCFSRDGGGMGDAAGRRLESLLAAGAPEPSESVLRARAGGMVVGGG
jgi:hypothetical protein